MADTRRFERMLFDYQTTNRTDMRGGEIQALVARSEDTERARCVRARPAPLKHSHTMSEWRDCARPPFDLLLKPKEIVRTDPRHCQQVYEKPTERSREAAQRTRPRVVMTPAVVLDDVAEAAQRDLLCRYTYTTSAMAASEAAAAVLRARSSLPAPPPCHPAPAHVTQLKRSEVPYVHPAWRRRMLEWDNQQLRTHADVDRHFWMRQNTTCNECVRTTQRNEATR